MIAYKLIRCRRRTISIILKNGEVIVRSPLKTPIEEIEKFVRSKEGWINKHIDERNFLADVVAYKTILVKGKELPLSFGDENVITESSVCVTSLKSVCKLYLKTYKTEFLGLFNDVVSRCNFTCGGVSFRSYKSRWGCCDRKGNITFNIKLLMLPERLWLCVILHELCHTVYMNHSADFHKLFESLLKNHRAYERELKRYSPVCDCY